MRGEERERDDAQVRRAPRAEEGEAECDEEREAHRRDEVLRIEVRRGVVPLGSVMTVALPTVALRSSVPRLMPT